MGALTTELGYRSKTSLERLMNGSTRDASLERFEENVRAAFELTEEEQAQLHEAVQVARQGDVSAVDGVERTAEDAYLSGREGHGNEGEGMGCGAIGSQNRSRAGRPPPWHAPGRR